MATQPGKKTVIVFGATGAVGRAMLDLLIKDKVLGDVKVRVSGGGDAGREERRVWARRR